MNKGPEITRRQFLVLSGATAVSVLAGCGGNTEGTTPTSSPNGSSSESASSQSNTVLEPTPTVPVNQISSGGESYLNQAANGQVACPPDVKNWGVFSEPTGECADAYDADGNLRNDYRFQK